MLASAARIHSMKQAALALNLCVRKASKREFLEQIELVVPWAVLVGLITPFHPEGLSGSPPCSFMTMLRISFMQQCFIACPTPPWMRPFSPSPFSVRFQSMKSMVVCP
jgi:hypothetical protein